MLKNKDKIIKVLENGGVIVYVTDTVWGLGCLPDSTGDRCGFFWIIVVCQKDLDGMGEGQT